MQMGARAPRRRRARRAIASSRQKRKVEHALRHDFVQQARGHVRLDAAREVRRVRGVAAHEAGAWRSATGIVELVEEQHVMCGCARSKMGTNRPRRGATMARVGCVARPRPLGWSSRGQGARPSRGGALRHQRRAWERHSYTCTHRSRPEEVDSSSSARRAWGGGRAARRPPARRQALGQQERERGRLHIRRRTRPHGLLPSGGSHLRVVELGGVVVALEALARAARTPSCALGHHSTLVLEADLQRWRCSAARAGSPGSSRLAEDRAHVLVVATSVSSAERCFERSVICPICRSSSTPSSPVSATSLTAALKSRARAPAAAASPAAAARRRRRRRRRRRPRARRRRRASADAAAQRRAPRRRRRRRRASPRAPRGRRCSSRSSRSSCGASRR